MNKKGSVLFFVIIVMLAGFLLFLSLNNKSVLPTIIKGQWQIDFLEQNYLPAKKAMLAQDIMARDVGVSTIQHLASKGGFSEESPCGMLDGRNLWNIKDQFCFPDALNNAKNMAGELLKDKKSGEKYLNLDFHNNLFTAGGDSQVIQSELGRYTFSGGFAVDVRYDFAEYQQLKQEAANLVLACREEEQLQSCLEEQREEEWNFADCEQDEFVEDDHKVAFCIKSPRKTSYFAEGHKLIPLQYNLALDFS